MEKKKQKYVEKQINNFLILFYEGWSGRIIFENECDPSGRLPFQQSQHSLSSSNLQLIFLIRYFISILLNKRQILVTLFA